MQYCDEHVLTVVHVHLSKVTPFLAAWKARSAYNETVQTIMSRHPALTYQVTTPPAYSTCQGDLCGSVAAVRLTIPRPRFTADGLHDDDGALVTWDTCDLHWPSLRDTCVRSGHQIVDQTGDLRRLSAEFTVWNIWRSDQGRLYASARLNGSVQGTTVHAYLVGHLRAQMESMQRAEARHV